MPSFASLPGFRDFYPPEFSIRSHTTNAWREVARRYGFEEYDGPPLEPLELYTEKSGQEIVGQLYNFVDKGDRAVALREGRVAYDGPLGALGQRASHEHHPDVVVPGWLDGAVER